MCLMALVPNVQRIQAHSLIYRYQFKYPFIKIIKTPMGAKALGSIHMKTSHVD